jgi:hypothetical protein
LHGKRVLKMAKPAEGWLQLKAESLSQEKAMANA